MAFEQINNYIEILRNTILKIRKKRDEQTEKEERLKLYSEERIVFNLMLDYYESVLQIGKFKGQKQHCKNIMVELEPAFCQGYFKTKKPTIAPL